MPSTPVRDTPSTNPFLKAIQWGGWRWDDGGSASTSIAYHFQGSGENLSSLVGGGAQSGNWGSYEKTAYRNALSEWSKVANIKFTEVSSYLAADLVENVYSGSGSILGAHETPQDASKTDGTAWGAYNRDGAGWGPEGLKKGGYGFTTLVHEIGHGLGLSHPHDKGGGSSRFPGVTSSGDLGDYTLNQGIFTVMSYNDGWETGLGSPPSLNYGWQSGPGAFDIAAIQNLYGANTAYHRGNDTYRLGHVGGQPDDLSCIWDARGTDTMRYDGSFDSTLDLRAATLKNGPGAGGFVSYVDGAPKSHQDHWDAYTIAKGVVIENAIGGSNDDHITGNTAKNALYGRGGDDTIKGLSGVDIINGGAGKDTLTGGADRDVFIFKSAGESRLAAPDVITDFKRGTDDIHLAEIDAKSGVAGNNAFNWIGSQAFHGVKGELHFRDLGTVCRVEGDINGDGSADFQIVVVANSLSAGDFIV